MEKEKFKKICQIMGFKAPQMAEIMGVSQSTIRGWKSRGGPDVPLIGEKLLRYEFKERGLKWPED